MQHPDYFCDYRDGRVGNFEPGVEGGDQLGADIFARLAVHVVEGPKEDLFFLYAPGMMVMMDELVAKVFWWRVGRWTGHVHAHPRVLLFGRSMRTRAHAVLF